MPDLGSSGEQPSRWSRLGFAAQIATILGLPIGVVGVVIAVLALQSSNNGADRDSGTPAATENSPPVKPLPAPTENVQLAWIRDQGRICQQLNREAEANPSSPPSSDLADQLPTLRAASTSLDNFIRASSQLEPPDKLRGDVQVMLGHWSSAATYMTGMIRSAEQRDASRFDARLEQFNSSMEQGMRVARGLGATQCT